LRSFDPTVKQAAALNPHDLYDNSFVTRRGH